MNNMDYKLSVSLKLFKSDFMNSMKSEKIKPLMRANWISNVKYINLSDTD